MSRCHYFQDDFRDLMKSRISQKQRVCGSVMLDRKRSQKKLASTCYYKWIIILQSTSTYIVSNNLGLPTSSSGVQSSKPPAPTGWGICSRFPARLRSRHWSWRKDLRSKAFQTTPVNHFQTKHLVNFTFGPSSSAPDLGLSRTTSTPLPPFTGTQLAWV